MALGCGAGSAAGMPGHPAALPRRQGHTDTPVPPARLGHGTAPRDAPGEEE